MLTDQITDDTTQSSANILGGFDALLTDRFTQLIQNLFGRIDTDVGSDQKLFELFKEIFINADKGL